MRLHIFILLLAGITCSLAAQETDTAKLQSTDSTSLFLQPRGCVNIFRDQTVSGSTAITGCSTLTLQNVTVTNTGNITCSAPQEVIINGDFEVQKGGVLNVNDALIQFVFSYSYDAAGNRITRRFSTTSSANALND